jgi:hypothetical protein
MAGRLLIVEPSLIDTSSHHAIAAGRFALLAGVPDTVIAAGTAWNGAPALAGAPILPIFKHQREGVGRIRRYGPLLGRALAVADHIARPVVASMRRYRDGLAEGVAFPVATADVAFMRSVMVHDLKSCLATLRIDADDCVFLPSADAELVLATTELLESNGSPPSFHLRLMYDDTGSHSTDPTWRSALGALACARGAGDRVHMLVETESFARAVRDVWSGPVALLPHPSNLTLTAPSSMLDAFTLYVAGQARSDKGHHLVAAVVRALSTKLKGGHLHVRLRIHGEAVAGSPAVTVERLPAHVPDSAYVKNWQQAHGALLLHDPKVYELRGSGVVCDAVASGRPFIHLSGTSLAEWGGYGNAIAAQPSPEGIADAIVHLAHNYNAYADHSAVAATHFPETLRVGLAGIVDCVDTH